MKWLLPAVLIILVVPLWAQTAEAPATPLLDPTRALIQALLSLCFVVALIYAAYYLLRRVQAPWLKPITEGPIQILQTVPLAGGNVLYVIEESGRLLMLTSGASGVTIIGEAQSSNEGAEDDSYKAL